MTFFDYIIETKDGLRHEVTIEAVDTNKPQALDVFVAAYKQHGIPQDGIRQVYLVAEGNIVDSTEAG